MGSISAQKARQVLENVQTVIAIEFMVAAQGMDFSRIHPTTHKLMNAGKGVQAAYDSVRRRIKHLNGDRVLHDDIQIALSMVKENSVLVAVEKAIGELQ